MGTLFYSSSFCGRRQLRWPVTVLAFFALLSTAICQIITGDPPSFPNTDNPQDQFVFRIDDDGNPVDLVFLCPVEGTDPLTINWYRRVGDDFVLDNEFKIEDGSYVHPNITDDDEDTPYASGVGVQYYCTATNNYGTIRSRTVRAVYAAFNGFLNTNGDVADPIELEDEGTLKAVDVIDATVSGRQQWVALQCPLAPDSTPTPVIQWISRDIVADSRDILPETETSGSIVRFLNDGEWLIMQTPTSRITNKQYYCQVTNVRRFNTERGPITYILNPLANFNGPPIVYRNLTSRTVPASSTDAVRFGTAVASSVNIGYIWRLDNDQSDSRLDESGPTADITPSPKGDDKVIDIQLEIIPTGGTTIIQEATLTLQDPAVLIAPTPENMGDVLSGGDIVYECNAGGSNPTITFFHNGVELISGSSTTYTISSSSPTDSGMYQCLVENDSGSQEASWFLIVRDAIKPELTPLYTTDMTCRDTPLVQKNEGPIVLTVNVRADPCPSVVWTVDGAALPAGYTADDGCRPLGNTLFNFTLTVATLPTKPTAISATFTNVNEATSEVVGSTELPTVYIVGQVSASIPDDGLVVVPDSPIGDTDIRCLSADSTVQIICENVGYPLPTVVFRKDLEPIDLTGDRFTQNCNTLTITGVVAEDAGSYDCTVENIPNDPETVEDRSEPPLQLQYCIQPMLDEELTFTNKNPTEGEETVVSCASTGSPTPVITWIKDGVALDEKDLPSRFRITEAATDSGAKRSNLEIDNVQLEDTGEYKCNVSNAAGDVASNGRLEVQAGSEPPLSETIIIAIAAGGGFFFVLLTLVIVLLCCVWHCARRNQEGSYSVDKVGASSGIPLSAVQVEGGPQVFNVDAPDGPVEPEEPFNPDYASLPSVRPAQPPQYKPTPHYPSEMPPPDMEYQKRIPSEEDFVGPYGQDNGGMHHQPYQPTVDDFVSDDAQFV